jgi:hypothetical protein
VPNEVQQCVFVQFTKSGTNTSTGTRTDSSTNGTRVLFRQLLVGREMRQEMQWKGILSSAVPQCVPNEVQQCLFVQFTRAGTRTGARTSTRTGTRTGASPEPSTNGSMRFKGFRVGGLEMP